MASAPLVSVIIPAHNRAHLLREAVACVLAQSWRPIEIVLVDDGSTDDTFEAAQDIALAHPGVVVAVSRPNGGPGAARQTGFEISQGEFVQFLDSDDLIFPEKLTAQMTALLSDPDAGIAYGRTILELDGVRKPAPTLWSGRPTRQLFPALLTRRYWDTSNPLYRRGALTLMGPWAPRRQLEDWEFDCRAAGLGIPVHFCDLDVSLHRSHAENRLHLEWMSSSAALRDRAWAHEQAFIHASKWGVDYGCPEFLEFLRSVFLMARACGSRGLVDDADRLLNLVRQTAVERRFQIHSFAWLRSILGWRLAVSVAEGLRRNREA